MQLLEILVWVMLENIGSANECFQTYQISPNPLAVAELKQSLNPSTLTLNFQKEDIVMTDHIDLGDVAKRHGIPANSPVCPCTSRQR